MSWEKSQKNDVRSSEMNCETRKKLLRVSKQLVDEDPGFKELKKFWSNEPGLWRLGRCSKKNIQNDVTSSNILEITCLRI